MTHEERAGLRRELEETSVAVFGGDASFWKPYMVSMLDALDAAESRAALAERQVRVLAELFCGRHFPCPELCPAFQRNVCTRYCTTGAHCVDNWLGRSSAQAAQGGGDGE